jgi:hypothetical protein
MQYGLRLPTRVVQEGLPAGARTVNTWSTGGQMDIQQEIGKDWLFGTWDSIEETWCVETFREHESS